MSSPERETDPRARGFLRAWVSGAMLWSSTTKNLLAANGFGEAQLAMVSLYLCLKEAHLLVAGKPPRVPGDEVALADPTYDANGLMALRDRAKHFRDEILHLSDKSQAGRAVHVSWTADPPHFVIKSSIGQRGKLAWDSISRAEVEDLLATLDPWLHRHWERLVHEDDDEVHAAALGAKIDATMEALGGVRGDEADLPEGS
jgi:hypothetical protein